MNGLRKKTNGDGFIEPKSTGQIIFTKDVLITSAQLKGVIASPVNILPDRTDGKIYVVHFITYKFNNGTTVYVEYDTSLDTIYAFSYGDTFTDGSLCLMPLSAKMDTAAVDMGSMYGYISPGSGIDVTNKGIYLISQGLDLSTSAGDGTLAVHLTYEVVEL